MTETMTKGEYAAHRGVTPAAVSQWIAGGKLPPEALDGEGRRARVRVSVADSLLKGRLDPGQQLARGGRPSERPALPEPPPTFDHAARYQKAKAEAAEIDTERQRRKMLAEDGVLMVVDDARASWSRELASLIASVDAWLPDLASAVMGAVAEAKETDTPLDAKRLTVVMRNGWRELRARESDRARRAADQLSELVPERRSRDEAA